MHDEIVRQKIVSEWAATDQKALLARIEALHMLGAEHGKTPAIRWVPVALPDLQKAVTGLWKDGGKYTSPFASNKGMADLEALRSDIVNDKITDLCMNRMQECTRGRFAPLSKPQQYHP